MANFKLSRKFSLSSSMSSLGTAVSDSKNISKPAGYSKGNQTKMSTHTHTPTKRGQITKIRYSNCMASSLSVTHNPTKCLQQTGNIRIEQNTIHGRKYILHYRDNCRCVAIVVSLDGVYNATNKCRHRAASSKANVCI